MRSPMKVWTIYCHTHVRSGRRYVGLTSQTWERRWKNHVWDATHVRTDRGWSHFANAIRKHGPKAFDHVILQECSTLEDADRAEAFAIELLCTRDPAFGFNFRPGGEHVPRKRWDGAAASRRMKAMWKDPARRAAQAVRGKAIFNRPDVRAKAAACGPAHSSVARALMKEHLKDPAFREKVREGIRRAWNDGTMRRARGLVRPKGSYVSKNGARWLACENGKPIGRFESALEAEWFLDSDAEARRILLDKQRQKTATSRREKCAACQIRSWTSGTRRVGTKDASGRFVGR
jgi:hypothetical protein